MTQATRAASHTSLITRAIAISSSVGGSLPGSPGSLIALVSIVVSCVPTTWISGATEASANMKARVSASVRCGSRCSPRVVPRTTCSTRSSRVPPGIGRRSSAACAASSRVESAETSRWILDGK